MLPQNSTVHLYLSAPGDDLAIERRLVIDVVVPELRLRASRVGIAIETIDPEDWPPDTNTLSRRLLAIRDTRPLFVGILGRHMGRPETIPQDLVRDFPWLEQMNGAFSREIESAFAQHCLAHRCFFYEKRADFIDDVPAGDRAMFEPARSEEALGVRTLSKSLQPKQYRFIWARRWDPAVALPGLAEQLCNDLWAAIAPPEPTGPLPFHDDVQFTVYRPRVAPVRQWTPLLAFAHLGEPPLGSASDDDPVRQVERRAEAVLGDRLSSFASVRHDSSAGLPDEAEVTFVLNLPAGVEVKGPRRTFLWINSVHMEEFAIRPDDSFHGRTVRGALSVFHGSILLAEVLLTIGVGPPAVPESVAPQVPTSVAPFRNIFPSYSHRDTAIVQEFEAYAEASGDRYLRDVRALRSGEIWDERLCDFIRDADVFQLFWSDNSMQSQFVEKEWRYALTLGRQAFVRPTFWQEPLPAVPIELQQFHFSFANRINARPAQPAFPQAVPPPPAPSWVPPVQAAAPPPMPSWAPPVQAAPPPPMPSWAPPGQAEEKQGRRFHPVVLIAAIAVLVVVIVALVMLLT